MEIFRVSRNSNPNSLAGAIAKIVVEEGVVEIHVIGAAALNQAVKAIAIAQGFLAPQGIRLAFKPSFADVLIGGEERTALRLLVLKQT